MIDYYQQTVQVRSDDLWINCNNDPDNSRCFKGYREADRRNYGLYGRDGREFLALERCNFVSNMAYYRSATRLCDYDNWKQPDAYRKALKQSFATLATGSGYMHASHTTVGHRYDVSMMGIIVYISYQAMMEKLGATSNTLKYMMDTTALEAVQLAEDFAYMPLDYQPHEWLDRMENLRT